MSVDAEVSAGDNEAFTVLARRDPFKPGLDILIEWSGGVASPLEFRTPTPDVVVAPTMSGASGEEFLQACLNCAWEAGLRPPGFVDSDTATATEKHLQDMRTIVFHQLSMAMP